MTKKEDRPISDKEREALVFAINQLVEAAGDLNKGLKVLTETFVKCCAHSPGPHHKPMRYSLKRLS